MTAARGFGVSLNERRTVANQASELPLLRPVMSRHS
jgi:hypothetical protein